MLPFFAAIVAASTALLIFAGGLVTSTGSGLSVPDWPNTYGWFMFTFPLDKMVGGIFYEHGHRLIASVVGFLILVLAAWLWRAETRRWVRLLGIAALGTVVLQGILGGITVLWYLPDPISIAHAGLAQLVFGLTMTIALVTSEGWKGGYAAKGIRLADNKLLQRTALVTTLLIYGQIVVGAIMRHTGAGLAIPDFPLAFGGIVPTHWDAKIAIHFAHRIGAVLVVLSIVATARHVLSFHRRRRELTRLVWLLIGLTGAQITLGAYTVLTQKEFVINSLHVVTGACVFVTALALTLRAYRPRFEMTRQVAPGVANFRPRSIGARA